MVAIPGVHSGQSPIKNILLELVEQSLHVEVRRETTPVSLHVDECVLDNHDAYSYLLHLKLVPVAGSNATDAESAPQSNGDADVIETKYLLGCDGGA